MAPGLVDDAATQRALVAHAGVRAIVELWDRLDVALFGIGGPAWSAAQLGDGVEHELESTDAVGEVLVAPFDLDGRFVCPALRERVIAFDARRLGRVPVAIGVAAGASKVRPILGALRAGVVRTLVTDVATAEAVVALDAATLATGRSRRDDRHARAGDPRPRPRHDRGQGRSRRPRRPAARPDAQRLRARRRRRPRLGRAGPGRLVVRGRAAPSAPCVPPTSPRSSRSASTATARRSRPSTPGARRPGRRSRSSTPARRPRPTSWPRRPASAAGRWPACRPRCGSSATSRPWPRRRAGTSRPGSGSRSA